jgi:hypothetical protein
MNVAVPVVATEHPVTATGVREQLPARGHQPEGDLLEGPPQPSVDR